MTPSPRTAGLHQYKLTNHLGNVSVIVSDNKLLSANQSQKLYLPDVLEYQDYYPFGMVMNERKGSYTDRDYRYGYNGKENDNEVKGESNQQDYGFRVYDPRVGRFLSVDPLTQSYPFYSLYQFAGNMPIWAGDVDGLEPNLEHCEDGINSYYSVNPRDISIDRTSPVNFGKGGFVFFPVSLGSKSIGWLASAKYSEEEFKNDTYGYQGDNSNTSGQFYDDAYIIRHDNFTMMLILLGMTI